MVFVYHNRKYWLADLHPQVFRFFNEFHIGVALFFVLSGFLIAYTYNDQPMHSGKAYTRYILLRLARILPYIGSCSRLIILIPHLVKGNQPSCLPILLPMGFLQERTLMR
jgi:peptidoglycan/LPS O-acetylase OafA/YrhL